MSSLEESVLANAAELVRIHMAKYDPSHDWAHVDRVRKLALKIGEKASCCPDMSVIHLAALFHDMAAKYGPTSTLQSQLEPFFTHPSTASLLTLSQISLILQIIPSVSWSTESKLRSAGQWTSWHEGCVELHAVQDADRLDAIGAVGILRCAAFGGAHGRVLVDEGDEQASAEGHFDEKLLHVKNRMKTEYGRVEAVKRHETMVQFLAALRREKSL